MAGRLVSIRLPEETYRKIQEESHAGTSVFIRELVDKYFKDKRKQEIDAAFERAVSDPEDEAWHAHNAREVFLRIDEE